MRTLYTLLSDWSERGEPYPQGQGGKASVRGWGGGGEKGEAAFHVRLSAIRHLYFSRVSAFPFRRVTARRDDSLYVSYFRARRLSRAHPRAVSPHVAATSLPSRQVEQTLGVLCVTMARKNEQRFARVLWSSAIYSARMLVYPSFFNCRLRASSIHGE